MKRLALLILAACLCSCESMTPAQQAAADRFAIALAEAVANRAIYEIERHPSK